MSLFAWAINLILSNRITLWLQRRQWRRFKFCLPALMAGVVLVVAVGMVFFIRERHARLQARYHHLALSALVGNRFEVARVACLRGLEEERNEQRRPEWLFYLSMAMNGLGNSAAASDLLVAASPLNRAGWAKAHLLVAQTFLNATNLTRSQLGQAEQHLQAALVLEPQLSGANELLGRFYLNTQRPALARARFLNIYPAQPAAAFLIAISYDMEKNGTEALRWGNLAVRAVRDRLVALAPEVTSADRLELVQAVWIKGKYSPLKDPVERAMLTGTNAVPQNRIAVWLDLVRELKRAQKYWAALEILDRAAHISPSPVYPAAVADICVDWVGKLPLSQTGERLRLIQKGLRNTPLNLKLCWLLIEATHALGPTAVEAKKTLDGALADATGPAAAWWYLLLWRDARMRGDLATGRAYLKTAEKFGSQIPHIQNDIAMDLATTGQRQDLERGRAIIDAVIEKFPSYPGFRETRGRILAGLGRNEAAVRDLEFAVDRLADPRETRLLLGKVKAALVQSKPAS